MAGERMARRELSAGPLYFALVFAAGIVLGTVRTLWIEPGAGALAATLIELPLILGIAWLACRWAVRTLGPGEAVVQRLVMGAAFLALLWSAEYGVGRFLIGRDWAAQWAALTSPAGLAGLTGQIAAAFFPLFQRSKPSA